MIPSAKVRVGRAAEQPQVWNRWSKGRGSVKGVPVQVQDGEAVARERVVQAVKEQAVVEGKRRKKACEAALVWVQDTPTEEQVEISLPFSLPPPCLPSLSPGPSRRQTPPPPLPPPNNWCRPASAQQCTQI